MDKKKVKETLEKVKNDVKCKVKDVDSFIKKSPYKAVACGVAIGTLAGVLTGLLLRRKCNKNAT